MHFYHFCNTKCGSYGIQQQLLRGKKVWKEWYGLFRDRALSGIKKTNCTATIHYKELGAQPPPPAPPPSKMHFARK